ncbi:unnamed protein product [Caretta caretta]
MADLRKRELVSLLSEDDQKQKGVAALNQDREEVSNSVAEQNGTEGSEDSEDNENLERGMEEGIRSICSHKEQLGPILTEFLKSVASES